MNSFATMVFFKSSLPLLLFILFLSVNPSEQQSNSPYVLSPESFQVVLVNQNGFATLAPRFSQISNVLRGLDNYLLSTMEMNHSTFATPHHVDAEQVIYIISGRGTIHVMQQQKKESYSLRRGDVLRIPASSMHYFINTDYKEKLEVAFLFIPVATPGEFWPFYGAGGITTGTYFNSFSDELLEAAFNGTRSNLDRVFRQTTEGAFVKGSEEQIRALGFVASSSSVRGSYNLLNKRPTHSNQYGQLYEVLANQYKQLQDLDVAVTFHNITKGAMVAPFINSRATSFYIVTDGTGSFQMVTNNGTSYERVSAQLSPGSAVIVLAGRPVSFVASDDQNLQLVAFKVNAKNNQMYYVAGRNNLFNLLESEAKDLSFNVSSTVVESILNNQRYSVFLPGPSQRQQ